MTTVQETQDKVISSETLEMIEQMFRSNDHELRRLAQKMCHSLRISYYVTWVKMFKKQNRKRLSFSLNSVNERKLSYTNGIRWHKMINEAKIKLK